MSKGRAPCCDKSKVKRGPWSSEEDLKLTTHIQKFGHANWRALPAQAGLLRCGKSCRLRWINYLKPDVKRGNITLEEERTIINLHKEYGNKWSKIASHLPGRTDNEVKNVWNTYLKKKIGAKDHSNTKASNYKRKPKKCSLPSTSMSSSSSTTSTISSLEDSSKLYKSSDIPTISSNADLKELASPSISCISNNSSFDRDYDNINPTYQTQDELVRIPVDQEMDDIWYMLEGMDTMLSYDGIQNCPELNSTCQLNSSFGHDDKVIDRDALRHVEMELGLDPISEENNGSLPNQNADNNMQMFSGSSWPEEVWTLESSTMAYLV